MAAKVVWYRGAWWLRTRWGGDQKRDRRFGPAAADKRAAEKSAEKVTRLSSWDHGTRCRGAPSPPLRRCCSELAHEPLRHLQAVLPGVEQGHRRQIMCSTSGETRRCARSARRRSRCPEEKIEAGSRRHRAANCLSVPRRVLNLLQWSGEIERNVAARARRTIPPRWIAATRP